MKIAIAGYGVEGESSYRYWNTSDNQVVIVDEHQPSHPVPVDASLIVGEDAFAKLNGYDLVIRTAGLAPHKIKTDGKVWSATNEFFEKCPAPIIGVTGSKGKGTTSSLITSMLRSAGKTVHLVGNIGVPALDTLADVHADDIVVYELSSFQLWDVERSPHVAVVLMIEADHLDVHRDFENYVQAKANIARYQTAADYVIYNASNQSSTQIARLSTAQQIPYQTEQSVRVQEGQFYYANQALCSLEALRLPGYHNQDNACAAITAVLALDNTVTPEAIEMGLSSFTGLPHRLRFVRNVQEVAYFDDSIATTPGSAIAAIHAFDAPKVLILGGSDKGADYTDLVDEIIASDTVRAVITVGRTGVKIKELLQAKAAGAAVTYVDSINMGDFVKAAAMRAQSGDVVILSPASASFDMFKNYGDRGDQFIAAVEKLEES
ncbi:MAG TPA: UDP-N-acetylmuramoyl-L-alanine--D-glutamate ligase [Candidatus Saccharimonadales bacterium]